MIRDIENFIKQKALELLVKQLEQVKIYSKERRKQIATSDKKYSFSDCYIQIGKIEAFEEIEKVITEIQEEYDIRLEK